MENYRKIIGTLVIIFLSIFFVHNANAVELNISVEPTGNKYICNSNWTGYMNSNISTTPLPASNACQVVLPNTTGTTDMQLLNKIVANNNFHFVEGNYYSFFIGLRSNSFTLPVFWNKNVGSQFSIIKWDQTSFETALTQPSYCSRWSQNNNVYTCTSTTVPVIEYSDIIWFEVVLKAEQTGDFKLLIGNPNDNLTSANLLRYYNLESEQRIILTDVVEYKTSDQVKEAEEKTEEQSEEGQNNADQADSDNEQATSSLLDIAGNIIGALTSSTTGTCTFNADLGNVDFGELNLCSGKPPEFANIIDIVIMLMLIPLIFMTVVSLVHQFVNLTKFAQGGD